MNGRGEWLLLLLCIPSMYNPSLTLACPIILPVARSWNMQWSRKKVTLQFMSLINFGMDNRFVIRLGTCSTLLRGSEGLSFGLQLWLEIHQPLWFFYCKDKVDRIWKNLQNRSCDMLYLSQWPRC
jgi:hypothetical protein